MNKSFNTQHQNELAEQYRKLHHQTEPLILANAWDCISAKIVEEAGYSAIATTSAGVAWANGYKDGENIPTDIHLDALQKITRVTSLPVTADIEGGYFRNDLEKFGQFIQAVIEAGVVGINLEDGYNHSEKLNTTEYQVKQIEKARAIANQQGVNLFINARTDAQLLSLPQDEKLKLILEKATAFQQAGADCLFVPFIRDVESIVSLKQNCQLPLNILIADTLHVSDLKKIGVERISVGARPIMAAMNALKKTVQTIKDSDNWKDLFEIEVNYDEVNGWF